MTSSQQLLFPDSKPLVERLGREFFRQAPQAPGVYLMRDASDAVLYVGKAKNLRNRLRSYRVANPDRLARRHLRLLRAVVRIELELCADERAALDREAQLLRLLRPKFNRVGTWSPTLRFLVCSRSTEAIQLRVVENLEGESGALGSVNSGARMLYSLLARVLWIAVHPKLGLAGLPYGWAEARRDCERTIYCGAKAHCAATALERFFGGHVESLCEWVRGELPSELHVFDKAAVESDLESLMQFAGALKMENNRRGAEERESE